MKKAIDFAICALWVLGTIGGIGYSIYEGLTQWPQAWLRSA